MSKKRIHFKCAHGQVPVLQYITYWCTYTRANDTVNARGIGGKKGFKELVKKG